MSSLASLTHCWRPRWLRQRTPGEKKVPDMPNRYDTNYLKALPVGQKLLTLNLLPKDEMCALCNGVGVLRGKVCEDCHGSGLIGEYEKVEAKN